MDEKKEKAAKRLMLTMAGQHFRAKDISKMTGIPKASISHYTNGNRIPDVKNAFKIGKILGVAPEWLMAEDDADFMIVEKTELQQEIAEMGVGEKIRLLEFAKWLNGKAFPECSQEPRL